MMPTRRHRVEKFIDRLDVAKLRTKFITMLNNHSTPFDNVSAVEKEK